MFREIAAAIVSIASSLEKIAWDIGRLREMQEKMMEQATQTKESMPQQFLEIFAATKEFLEKGGIKGGE